MLCPETKLRAFKDMDGLFKKLTIIIALRLVFKWR